MSGGNVMMEKKQLSYENLSKYRNVLMGVQIVLIIAFHFSGDAYYVRDSRIIQLFYKYIRSSGVDMFLLLSGIGLYFSWKKRPEAKRFYIKRYTRILIPYFIVAIPSWLWLDIFYEHQGWGAFLQDLFFVTFFTEGERWFWYIVMAAFCYWVFPHIFNIIESAADRVSAQMRILLLCVMSTVILVMLQLYNNELYNCIGIALLRIPAFLIGVLIGKAVYEKQKILRSRIYLTAVLTIILAWPLQFVGIKILGTYTLAYLNYALMMLFILVLEYLSARKSLGQKIYRVITSVFGWFGKYTLELYLTHVAVRLVMKRFEFPTYRISGEALLVIISIILSIIISRMTDYIQKKVVKY